MAKVFGSGLDSVRLLIGPDDSSDSMEKSPRVPPAGTHSLKFRMRYLRRVYSLLWAQFALISLVCFILHMTPGVRPFIQEHSFPLPLTVFLFTVSGFLLKKYHQKRHINMVLLLAFVISLICIILVISGIYDSESGYQITALIAVVFLLHALFCLQTLRDLNVVCAIMVSIFITILTSMFIQVFLALIYYDYIFNIFIANCFTTYAHINIRYYLFRYTFAQSDLGCISVYTTLFPFFRN